MYARLKVDELPSIKLRARVGKESGYVYLSQMYGSYDKKFRKVRDEDGSVIELTCPYCNTPFPEYQTCECGAPMIALDLKEGGIIRICTRNGCRNHALEFVDASDAFLLFQSQEESD